MGLIIFVINLLFSLAYLTLVVRAVLPWITSAQDNMVTRLTNPLLGPIRQGLPPQQIGMDVSPAVAILFLWLMQKALMMALGGF